MEHFAGILSRLLRPGSFLDLQNAQIECSNRFVAGNGLPAASDGYKSDLHNAEFGAENSTVIAKMQQCCPDIIVVTGDVVDAEKTNTDIAVAFLQKAIEIAPVYFVPGNHELKIREQYAGFRERIAVLGVTILEDRSISISKTTEYINLVGIIDPMFYGDDYAITKERLCKLKSQCTGFTILLSHRPELFAMYAGIGFDLVFSGHAHGGQFVLPGIGGLFAPHQGFFSKYAAGVYEKDGISMVVSHGLGNSSFPIRLNNHPELILVTLIG